MSTPTPTTPVQAAATTSVLDRARYEPGKVTSVLVLQSDRIRQVLFCVPAAGRLPGHRASCDVALEMASRGTIFLGDEPPTELVLGTHVFMPARTPHAVSADQDPCLLATFAEPDPEIRSQNDTALA